MVRTGTFGIMVAVIGWWWVAGAGPLLPAQLCQLQAVLQPTAPGQDVRVIRVVVALTRHSYTTQPIVLHLQYR